MAKKMIISLAIVILSLCCSVCCFAEQNNSNVNLGEEITDSLDKAGNSVRNVADDIMDGNNYNARNNSNNNYNNNNNMTGRTTNNNGYITNGNGYNAVRTSVDETFNNGTMSTTTWIWIILAVAAIVIVAMVWYYAVQGNND